VLTRWGWLVTAGSAALLLAGRTLGMLELYVLAAAGFALVLLALAVVRFTPVRVTATRELHPPKVYAGSDSRVELGMRNVGGRPTPVLTVRDPFDRGRRQARFLLTPLPRGGEARAAYRLPTQRRGIFTIGPLEVIHTDAFGLATATTTVAGATELTVYPHVDDIAALPQTRGNDPHAGADHPTALGLAGEDFYALREYVYGDDLRHVHWPSTARLDELMIRQHEMPWQGRATVLLDVRAASHTAESFELAVSAAASIVSACWQRGALVRLVSTDGADSGFAAGNAHVEAIMERLAAATPAARAHFTNVLVGLRRAGNAGALAAVVTDDVSPPDLERLSRLKGRYGSLTVVLIEQSAYRSGRPAARHADALPAFGSLVRVTAEQPLRDAWARAVAAPGAHAVATRLAP
jgi:uncharacterized protein (DUF58 family)